MKIKTLFFWMLFILALGTAKAVDAQPTSEETGSILGRLCNMPYPNEIRNMFDGACWFCKPFDVLLKTMLESVTSVFQRTQTGAIKLIAVGFALWLLWTTMRAIFDPRGGSAYIKQIGLQTLRVVFAIALLKMASVNLINTILGPPTDIILSYGLSVAKSTSDGTQISTTIASNDILSLFTLMDDEGKIKTDGLIGQLLMPLNNKVMTTLADGMILFAFSFQRGVGCLMPSIELFVSSLIIMFFSIILIAVFPLKIIDAAFRIGFVIIMIPLLIVAWTFPITKGYAKKGFDLFFSALIFFLTLCITVTVSLKMIDIALEPYKRSGFGFEKASVDQWIALFHTAATEFFILIGTFLLAIKLVSSTQTLARELGGNIGSGGVGKAAVAGAVAAGTTVGTKAYRTGRAAYKWGKSKMKPPADGQAGGESPT